MANIVADYQNVITEKSIKEPLRVFRSPIDTLEDVYIPPFIQSCVNYRVIDTLQDYNGIWAQKLIVDGTTTSSPFEYDQNDFATLQQHFDYFSKQVLAPSNQTFFSNHRAKYLLLRTSLCSFSIGANHENPFRNSYGWFVTDRPVILKLRMTLVEPEHNLAIATFLHENIGPQSLRKMDKQRGMEEISHLMVSSLKEFCKLLPELPGLEQSNNRLISEAAYA